MKKKIKKMHTLSSVACSATLLGTCISSINGISAYQGENNGLSIHDSFRMDVMDGTGTGEVGGGGTTVSFNGGTFSITVTSPSIGSTYVNVTISLTCTSTTDRFSCVGALLASTAIEQEISYQNACSLGVASTSFSLPCTTNGTYTMNFLCVNQTEQKVFANSSPTISFTCGA